MGLGLEFFFVSIITSHIRTTLSVPFFWKVFSFHLQTLETFGIPNNTSLFLSRKGIVESEGQKFYDWHKEFYY